MPSSVLNVSALLGPTPLRYGIGVWRKLGFIKLKYVFWKDFCDTLAMKSTVVLVFFFLAFSCLGVMGQSGIDFTSLSVEIIPVPERNEIHGQGVYTFDVQKNVDSVILDAKKMTFSKFTLNGKGIPYNNSGSKVSFKAPKKMGEYNLSFHYVANPGQTVYFLGWKDSLDGNEQIWTQGQGKYTSHWLPSFDDMTEKVEFDLNFVFDKDYEVIANGKLVQKSILSNGQAHWSFDMQNPMSSYLIGFAIGKFKKDGFYSNSNVLNENYYHYKDSLKAEPTYRYSKQIFDFLEEEIGVPYPWQNYKQIPVQDFLYAGMENTGATIFSNTFVVDSIAFVDRNYVNVNAHEMAHQWFGNLVTEQSGKHHWLHEGFATYYAYLAEKEIFGEDYFYWRLLETAKALDNFSGDGNGEALTNASAGSLTFYEKGAWALVMLRNRVGDEAFKDGIKNYLNKFAYQNVTIPDFMWEMEKVSGMKLSGFEEQWLQESEFPFEVVKGYLRAKSPSIKTYFEIKDLIAKETVGVQQAIESKWDTLLSERLKQQLILDYGDKLSAAFLGKLLNEEKLKVRQAAALSMKRIPEEIQSDFESLLADKSYKTIEAALFRLWTDFPENQKKYLDQTRTIIGFPNKNVRILWLTLALVTPDYEAGSKRGFFEELSGYTGTEYHFETRMLAFQFLKSIGAFNDATLKNLIQACNHHVWHFKKSSRKMLKEFLKGEGNNARVRALYPTLNVEQQQYLDKTLGK
ncbi:M1 family metallopeptidase [Flagellimonas myxillae]|uniref:M1 family metallopeptidase n=1 Tax=Flagellimonas myxillae TaxID=2942214 RepID=UPI00201F7FBC|nr:M1 family metallopeptidase [Muricauda myxillae]MCL6265800.1 M1 family metallopeptidase [Muricauda myxillae]